MSEFILPSVYTATFYSLFVTLQRLFAILSLLSVVGFMGLNKGLGFYEA